MSDPQRLISNCGNEIRKLADTERRLRAAMTDLRASMIRLDNFTQRADEKQWSDLDKVNAKIQEECHHAAVQLSAAIEVYLSMQDDVTEDEVNDMIAELTGLKMQLEEYQLDQHESFRILVAHAGEVGAQQKEAVEERAATVSQDIETANAEVVALKQQLKELKAKHANTTKNMVTESVSGATSYFANLRHKNKPKPAAEATPSTPTGTAQDKYQSSAQQAMDSQDKVSEHMKDHRALEEQIRNVEKALAEAQQRYDTAQAVMQILLRADWEATTLRTQAVIDYFKKEDEQINAFGELRKQLLNEVNAYLSAFEGLQAYPCPEREAVLKNMKQRVSATAPAWRKVEGLLTNDYAKGTK